MERDVVIFDAIIGGRGYEEGKIAGLFAIG